MLKKIIEEWVNKFNPSIISSIYVFGSYIKTRTANDIDILIIYSIENKSDHHRAIEYRKELKLIIERYLNKSADIILLSESEEKISDFALHESAKLLWSKQ